MQTLETRDYYISDLHLFHKNVTRSRKDFDNRPFENLEEIHSIFKENGMQG